MSENIVRVGVGVVCLNDTGQYLVGERIASHGAGTWSIPGGGMEFGESFEQCAAREVMEEAGIELRDIRVIAVANHYFPSWNGKHFVSVYCIGRTSGEPKIMEPDKCGSWSWRDDWNAFPQPEFVPYTKDVRKEDIELYKKEFLR